MSDRTLKEIEADAALMAWLEENPPTWISYTGATERLVKGFSRGWNREYRPLTQDGWSRTFVADHVALCLIRSAFVRELDANGTGVYLTSQGTYIVERGRGQGADSTVEELGGDGVFHEFDPGRDPEDDANGVWQTRAQAEMVAMRAILKERTHV